MKLEEIEEFIAERNIENEKLVHKLLAVAKTAKDLWDIRGIGSPLDLNRCMTEKTQEIVIAFKVALKDLERE